MMHIDAVQARRASRVMIVSHSSRLAGAELVMLDLVRAFGAGSSAFLFEDGPLREALAEQRIPVTVSRHGSNFASVKRDRSLTRALPHLRGMAAVTAELADRARRHNVVYANSQKAFVLAAPAAALARRPLVWHLHDILTSAHFGGGQRRLTVALANRFATRVVVPSKAAAVAFTEAGGEPALVRIVPNGLDVRLDPAWTGARSSIRASLGLPQGFLFGVFSRLAPWKGQHVALDALAQIPDAHCAILGGALFGESAYEQSLRDMAQAMKIADRVHFLGHRNDVPRLMSVMDAVVHPSVDPEPFGRTLVEAMLCRIPVVAARTGAVPEILDEGRSGLLVPPSDAAALASSLRRIMAGDAALLTMVDRAEERARRIYTASHMVAAIRDVTASLAVKAS
jgi:glycosyltransferase involved in cell wall biosynthesis